jgi:hypothetical protein
MIATVNDILYHFKPLAREPLLLKPLSEIQYNLSITGYKIILNTEVT